LTIEIGDRKLLVGGDVILSIGGQPFTEKPTCPADMQCLLEAYRPDDEVRVKILRGGEIVELTGQY
jgi:S1-C subfamily serine protease